MTYNAKVRDVPTWKMTEDELARVWAAEFGIVGRTGGWLYSPDGKALCHGWTSLTRYLVRRGIVKAGQGVNWRVGQLIGSPYSIARNAR